MTDGISRRTTLGLAAFIAASGFGPRSVWGQSKQDAPADAPAPADEKAEHWINAIAISADGKLAAGASTSRAIGIWELASGRLTKQLEFPMTQNSVGALAFTSDGKGLYAGNAPRRRRSQGKALLEYELETGTIVGEAAAEPNWVYEIATSAKTDWIATAGGGFDRSLRLWTKNGLQPHRIWPAHDSAVVAVAVSPDGRLIASGGANSNRGGRDPSVRIWDAGTARQLHKLGGHGQSVGDLVFTPDGRRLVSLSNDAVQVWAVDGAKLLSKAKLGEGDVNAKTIAPDGRWFASVTYGEKEAVTLRAVETGKVLQQWTTTNRHIEPITITPDSRLLLIGGADDTIEVRAAGNGTQLRSLQGLVVPAKPH